MHASSNILSEKRSAVSIILPTFNRARFLPQAIQSIRDQQFTDWELVIVDDGSTDDTRQLIRELTVDVDQTVRYVRQENQGAYAARNTGLDHAIGTYIAFFDSDDQWLPHHLKDCVEALETHQKVDWVFGACRVVEHGSGRTIAESTFYEQGRPRAFKQLRTQRSGMLQIIDDRRVTECTIEHGLFCGLQSSVMRSDIFKSLRIPPFRVGEDRLLPVFALKLGNCFAYLENVHVIYHVHDSNTSSTSTRGNVEGQLRNMKELIRAYEYLLNSVPLRRAEHRSVRRRLNIECFWHTGYAILWTAGRRTEALEMFRRGLRHWPWDWRCWKTYALTSAGQVVMPRRI